MSADLEERLKSHARAFDGLLSLIPAKLYYGEDNSDQWQRKKQTKEQKKAARMAKLDPDNVKTAKDVLDERAVAAAAAKKRKREDEDDPGSVDLDEEREKPKEGLKPKAEQKQKKQKTDAKDIPSKQNTTTNAGGTLADDKKQRSSEKRAAKRERKKAKLERSKAKRERQKARKADAISNEPNAGEVSGSESSDGIDEEASEDDGDDMAEAIDVEAPPPAHKKQETLSTATPISKPSKPVKQPRAAPTDNNAIVQPIAISTSSSTSPSPDTAETDSSKINSTSSSVSSIQLPVLKTPAIIKTSEEKPSLNNFTAVKPSAEDIRARLQARIEALRTARKADGPNGQPARSRQELLETRRKKEEERRAHKKELRRKAKEEEARKQDEELARRFSPGGSGSLLGSPRSPIAENTNFSFGRVAFNDGTIADSTLSSLIDADAHKKRGPLDPRSQLNAAEAKAARLAALDPAKRKEIEEKDMWLNARKRAHGEKVKDDTSLLKKALKRQEGKKGKSEKDWRTRTEGVEKGMKDRQKKREENLKKRREEKGSKKGKAKRPGFEGSFKAKHGKK